MRRTPIRNLFCAGVFALAIAASGPSIAAMAGGGPADMLAARANHTATLLRDGRVLVTGGDNWTARLASAEVFDPATNGWSPAGSMATARHFQTATLLSDGRVLVAGGSRGPGQILSSAEIYDPTTNSWSAAASMSTPRAFAQALRLNDGRVLISGGLMSGTSGDIANTAELYDPVSNTWSGGGTMNGQRTSHTMTLLQSGKVLVVGVTPPELYDPSSNSWSPAGAPVKLHYDHTATLLSDGRVLVVSGIVNGQYNVGCEIYDPATNSWSPAADLREARSFHTAVLLHDGRVLVSAGESQFGPFVATQETYDPSTNTWSYEPSLNEVRIEHTMTLMQDGRVLIAGGASGSGALASVEYAPVSPAGTSEGNRAGANGSAQPSEATASSSAAQPTAPVPSVMPAGDTSKTTDSLTLKPLNGAPTSLSTSTGQRLALLYAIPPAILLLAGAIFAYTRRRRRYGRI